ncbi:CDP-glucose 4,6-dehydratase (EC 4.2.1.45) [uncultured Gammaproteobacteria bacterium]|jgi:CDP-glucose 4,6-dehydratase|uniref:CDP-glucose 4,6-dehydratase n=1 Tax=thiotrophic endosymbiont of Bathymodiolus puteoserpentis (Logatchev) TaxID=343240 RepID=UPI0010BAEBAF|nr:CDP-glucose 4,6-dehydratase [thiotrophic endosymbiont of Bathymodiolus puteoserpentis (Logatchev)]CAC9576552.1 CDP-glucose 4,6-dehydratase (EC 4.2.1.45) [uncultured Gammaproteobacteria bacterium]CAC9585441.1 CDP-glucose 4,6-dehydratase (EC 4.2.1.45) [uncultured Gammaproteobacteria bacterium]CAC9649695.1 CDP-glucose 4,6-dehydratase (EC 4.2.1.45) [uncultured Gammaproteobacteria bacterium]CAC9986876.1 CDP-glucose 4,6-dehydratase (EC 4.2.1.45) [uncultured Gammaproteobacteria bacterium]CAC999164
MISQDFWKGKRVFLTGHTGFKGSWLSLWLTSLGAEVKGYALNPPTSPSLFNEAKIESIVTSEIGDIRNQDKLHKSMTTFNPDILLHMAAQPLVRYSYDNPVETYEVNVIGTAKVLEVARNCSNLKAIVNITTDKCYENDSRKEGYIETDSMGGYDPYSSSKGCAELVTSTYRRSFLQEQGIGIASVRAGNVIGGGDWADDRLIPDILRSFEKNESVIIRNPKATRPWQHVLEPLSGYLILLEKLYKNQGKYAEGWNFGPNEQDVQPVDWILDKMTLKWPDSHWSLDKNANPHEADFLKLNITKVKLKLGWKPVWELSYTLERIIDWHRAWLNKENMQAVCLAEIEEYTRDMNNENR